MAEVKVIDLRNFDAQALNQTDLTHFLESGNVILLKNTAFQLTDTEKELISGSDFSLKAKSIKYNISQDKVWVKSSESNIPELLPFKGILKRYCENAAEFVRQFLPHYVGSFSTESTSFRPIEASGRMQTPRHDDTKLHVDAFPSRPTAGKRLLRVFMNVNQNGAPRVWNVGESFEAVVLRFAPKILPPLPFSAKLMKAIGITKSLRTKYDHYMLKIHDSMKFDSAYQENVTKQTLNFEPGDVWIVYSDQVSHAVTSGNGLLEQTFMLAANKMQNSDLSPLHVLEKFFNKKLV